MPNKPTSTPAVNPRAKTVMMCMMRASCSLPETRLLIPTSHTFAASRADPFPGLAAITVEILETMAAVLQRANLKLLYWIGNTPI
jgi:hypothetical protein